MRLIFTLVLIILSGTIHAQRFSLGYLIQNSDTVSGQFDLIMKNGNIETVLAQNGNRIAAKSFSQIVIGGILYQQITVDDNTSSFFVQVLTGSTNQIQLAKSLSRRHKAFYLINGEQAAELPKIKLNAAFGRHLQACKVVSRSLSYRKLSYKQSDLTALMLEYYDCLKEKPVTWQKADSVEVNIAAKYFIHNSLVTAQQDKDYSGIYTDIVSNGLGFELELWANKKVSGIIGFQAYEATTTNFNADVPPYFDRNYRSEVTFTWENFEVPFAIKYNLNVFGFRPYIGLSSSIYFTKNLTVSENFIAPFFPQGTFINAPLNVDQQIAFGGIAGIKKDINQNISISVDLRYLARVLDFNLVRFDRNALNQTPIISTFKTGTLFIFSKPTDLTGFNFSTTEISFKIAYRFYSDFKSF